MNLRIKVKLAVIIFFVALSNSIAQESNYKEVLNLSYLPEHEIEVDSLQQLNLVLPVNIQQPPLLLWIGGGAWSFVNRHMEMDLARKLAQRGVAVAATGHRLSSGAFSEAGRAWGVQHPAHIEDIAVAFKWLVDHAEQYGYDAERIFVGGFSSGAHLAALLAMDRKYLDKHGLTPQHIKGIIPIGGTYDINHYYSVFRDHENPARRPLAQSHVMDVFGSDTTAFAGASPVTYLSELNTPMLLISESDSTTILASLRNNCVPLPIAIVRLCTFLISIMPGFGAIYRMQSIVKPVT